MLLTQKLSSKEEQHKIEVCGLNKKIEKLEGLYNFCDALFKKGIDIQRNDYESEINVLKQELQSLMSELVAKENVNKILSEHFTRTEEENIALGVQHQTDQQELQQMREMQLVSQQELVQSSLLIMQLSQQHTNQINASAENVNIPSAQSFFNSNEVASIPFFNPSHRYSTGKPSDPQIVSTNDIYNDSNQCRFNS